jgi:hypothetical protein
VDAQHVQVNLRHCTAHLSPCLLAGHFCWLPFKYMQQHTPRVLQLYRWVLLLRSDCATQATATEAKQGVLVRMQCYPNSTVLLLLKSAFWPPSAALGACGVTRAQAGWTPAPALSQVRLLCSKLAPHQALSPCNARGLPPSNGLY